MSLKGIVGVRSFFDIHRTPNYTPYLGVRCWIISNIVGQTISMVAL